MTYNDYYNKYSSKLSDITSDFYISVNGMSHMKQPAQLYTENLITKEEFEFLVNYQVLESRQNMYASKVDHFTLELARDYLTSHKSSLTPEQQSIVTTIEEEVAKIKKAYLKTDPDSLLGGNSIESAIADSSKS